MSLTKLVNRISHAYHVIRGEKGLVTSPISEVIPEQPTVSFSTLIKHLKKNPDINNSITFMAEAVVGMGFYTTADLPRAKRYVDQFNEDVNMDGLFLRGVKELIAYGNSVWEKIDPGNLYNLKILPLSSIKRFKRTKYGEVAEVWQRIGGKTVKFLRPVDELIHWKWDVIDGAPDGRGLLHYLCETRTYTVKFTDGSTKKYTTPALIDIKTQMDDDIRRVLHHYLPRSVYVFEGAKKRETEDWGEVIGKLDAGERIATNLPVKLVSETLDPGARFGFMVDHVNNMVVQALQNPVLRLFWMPGYTEASAKIAESQLERKITALQRYVKRVYEREIAAVLIEQAGMSPKRANYRIHWGMGEKPEVTLRDIIELAKLSAETGVQYMTPREVRKALAKMGIELLEEPTVAIPP
ncbi:MAG: hypothetical protein ACE5GD_08180 [Candidatus Geothermarchaeales archaeon]